MDQMLGAGVAPGFNADESPSQRAGVSSVSSVSSARSGISKSPTVDIDRLLGAAAKASNSKSNTAQEEEQDNEAMSA